MVVPWIVHRGSMLYELASTCAAEKACLSMVWLIVTPTPLGILDVVGWAMI